MKPYIAAITVDDSCKLIKTNNVIFVEVRVAYLGKYRNGENNTLIQYNNISLTVIRIVNWTEFHKVVEMLSNEYFETQLNEMYETQQG